MTLLISILSICLGGLSTNNSHTLTTAHPKIDGGIQLLMSFQQKERLVMITDFFKKDIRYIERELASNLFSIEEKQKLFKKVRYRVPKSKIEFDKITKDQLLIHSERLIDHYNNMEKEFQEVVINGGDNVVKKYFTSFLVYKKDVQKFIELDTIDNEFLFAFHDRTTEVSKLLIELTTVIKRARTATIEYIKTKLWSMSVWEWLFGYSEED